MVPFLYFFYDRPDLFGVVVAPEARVLLSHGTSLFVVLPTAIRGALTYNRSNLVEWRVVWPIGLASIVSAFAGARLAVLLPPEVLKTAFGSFLVFSGMRLVYRPKQKGDLPTADDPNLSLPRVLVIGGLVGVMSALLGVGGGTVAIPLLIYWLKLDIRKVAATSIGIIGLTAAAGTAGYVFNGLGAPGLPPWSLGYVHLSAGLAMFIGAIVSVRWGALLNQRMRPRTLEIAFGLLFVVLGVRLAGANLLALLSDFLRG